MQQQSSFHPLALKKDGDDRLIIEWSDGHRSVYSWQHLRSNCPCASCREERLQPPDPFRILKPSEIPAGGPIKPLAMTPLGRYAYKITWSDGHDTGLYTFETLRELCQCDKCQVAAERIAD